MATNEFYFFAPLNFGNKAITRVVTRQVWDKRSSIFEEIIWLFFSIRIYSDYDTSENIVEKSMVVAF
jgi:hypothetical protein